MMKLRIFSVLCVSACVMQINAAGKGVDVKSAVSVVKQDAGAIAAVLKQDAGTLAAGAQQAASAVKQDVLNELPKAEGFFSSLYTNHPYFCLLGVVGIAVIGLYFTNEAFKTKVNKLLSLDQTKSCGCGCPTGCGCLTGSKTGCSMKPNKTSESCACCAVRPATVK